MSIEDLHSTGDSVGAGSKQYITCRYNIAAPYRNYALLAVPTDHRKQALRARAILLLAAAFKASEATRRTEAAACGRSPGAANICRMAAASADDESPTPAGDAEAVDAGAPPGSGWASLPAPALLQVFAALPLAARLTLRLACHAFASALADAFGGVRADAPSLRAGRAAAARALARACPRAAHALLSVPAAGQPGDGAAAARALRIFLATKPRLARLHIQQLPASPAWGPAAAAAASPAAAAEDCEDLLAALASAAADSCAGSADGPVELPGEDAAAAKHAAAEPEAASAAPRLRALELDLTSAPPPASLASLSLFTSLREVRLRLRPPHRSGVAPAGVREVARLPLEALALPVDSSDPREVSALRWRCNRRMQCTVCKCMQCLDMR